MKEILITISFIKPNEKYLESYKEAYDEYIVNNIKSYGFTEPSLDIFDKFEKYRKGIDLKPGRVPSSYYWLVDEDSFIGEVSIRHYLTDELNNYGGNIGYGIRLTKQKQGYGTLILKFALEEAKALGLAKVLITCNDDNYGSIKVIENNGGILENKVVNQKDNMEIVTRRYWIDITN